MEANFSIDDARPLKVVVIGAGYSGMSPYLFSDIVSLGVQALLQA